MMNFSCDVNSLEIKECCSAGRISDRRLNNMEKALYFQRKKTVYSDTPWFVIHWIY